MGMTDSFEIARLFYKDVREKKSTATGAFKRKGKGVRHGIRGVRFPSDHLTKKQKLQMNGEVIIVNGLGKKLTYDELIILPEAEQKKIMEIWRETYPVSEIRDFMGIDKNVYYRLMNTLNVEKIAKGIARINNGKNKVDLPDATKEDIMPFIEFKTLSIVERLDLLNEYTTTFKPESVAAVWGKSLANLYNIRFQLRKKIEKEAIKQKMREQDFTQEQAQAQADMEVSSAAVPTSNNSGDFEMLREMIAQQNKVIERILSGQQIPVDVFNQGNESREPIEVALINASANNEIVNEDTAKSEMIFNYEDKKEGFLLHQDLKRFITVLEKNPDIFEVEIKIKRK